MYKVCKAQCPDLPRVLIHGEIEATGSSRIAAAMAAKGRLQSRPLRDHRRTASPSLRVVFHLVNPLRA
jgi:hypothetical protein